MRFGGRFDIKIEGETLPILLNLTALGEVEDEMNIPLQTILETIQAKPLQIIPRLLWHGHRVACWDQDQDPKISEKKFLARLGSMDWEEVTPKIIETLSTKEGAKKKDRPTPKG